MQFRIIGADGQEYGPVDLPTLKSWVRDGRVISTTTVIDADTTRRYLACDLPDLTDELSLSHSGPRALVRPGPSGVSTISSQQTFVPSYVTVPAFVSPPKSRIAAGLFGILLGAFGAHRFYLGHTAVGICMLLITLLTCGFGAAITVPWGIIEGILCLTGAMRDADGNALID